MRTWLLLAASLLACSSARPFPTRGQPVVSFEGKVEKGPHVVGVDDLKTLPRRAFLATAPFGGPPARFEGMSIASFLADAIELKHEADLAIFRGEGGRTAAVPLAAIRQLKPVLADTVDGGPVSGWRKEAAPLQLAWPLQEWPGIESDPRLRWWWVGAVTKVELASFAESYGKALRVPPGASDAARLGADVLATSCMACHRLRDTGGTKGPELTAALAGEPKAFATAMREHLRSASGQASAPEIPPAAAGQVLAFLRAVELAARPEDEVKEERPDLPPAVPGRPPGGS
jgi:hypothetical protein